MTGPNDDAGSVVLDLGSEVGAVVVYAPDDLVGEELQIAGTDSRGMAYRTHNVVRRRGLGPGTVAAAVFPSVPAGHYQVWRGPATPVDVVVAGGAVTEVQLP